MEVGGRLVQAKGLESVGRLGYHIDTRNHLVFWRRPMPGNRVFISFDFDNDKTLKNFIIGQARLPDSPFGIFDTSLKESAPMKTWEEKARAAIKRSNLVLVMVGPETHRASGVLKEIRMAREEGKPIVQVIGYRDGDYTPVPDAGRLYQWNWDNLKKLLG